MLKEYMFTKTDILKLLVVCRSDFLHFKFVALLR